ncbi:hypothetical protein ABVT39_018436 [Epinephelus coioides]
MGSDKMESDMATGSMKSIDSGVSLKSDRSKAEPTDFKDRVSVIGMDFSSSEEEEDVSDDGFSESPDDLMVKKSLILGYPLFPRSAMGIPQSEPVKIDICLPGSRQSPFRMVKKSLILGYPLFPRSAMGIPQSEPVKIDICLPGSRQSPFRLMDFDSDVSADLNKPSDDHMATGSLESSDSGVSLKSDQSKEDVTNFKDRVSPRSDFSSSEEEDVSDDEDLVESPDDPGGDEPGAVV